MDRWLTKEEYSKIRYRAKKMGARSVNLSCIYHDACFDHCFVSFAFKPFEFKINFIGSNSMFKGDFSTREDVEAITQDMFKALDFVDFLKEFNKTVV